MVKFWLENFSDLFSLENFKSTNKDSNKMLNIVSLIVLLVGLVLVYIKKQPIFFGVTVVVLSLIILIRSIIGSNYSKFSKSPQEDSMLSNQYVTTIKLIKNTKKGNNKLYVNNVFNMNKGDIILISDNVNSETHVVTDVQSTPEYNNSAIILLNNLIYNYSKDRTKIFKVSDSSPNIISPPDANKSILDSNKSYVSDPQSLAIRNFPKVNIENSNRSDWDLDLATYLPGQAPTYEYQGPPNGNLKCRTSTEENPMATINITEYDAAPTMYGTCNVGDLTVTNDGKVVSNDYLMTDNFEKTISMRVNDLLFHKGNSQSRFSPMPVDTLPDNQEAFANFCYRNPTNLVNPKYASIFVNDPKAFKLVTKLAKATGTENGGGGGGGGRGP
jgi:hypothetical protein